MQVQVLFPAPKSENTGFSGFFLYPEHPHARARFCDRFLGGKSSGQNSDEAKNVASLNPALLMAAVAAIRRAAPYNLSEVAAGLNFRPSHAPFPLRYGYPFRLTLQQTFPLKLGKSCENR